MSLSEKKKLTSQSKVSRKKVYYNLPMPLNKGLCLSSNSLVNSLVLSSQPHKSCMELLQRPCYVFWSKSLAVGHRLKMLLGFFDLTPVVKHLTFKVAQKSTKVFVWADILVLETGRCVASTLPNFGVQDFLGCLSLDHVQNGTVSRQSRNKAAHQSVHSRDLFGNFVVDFG